LQVAVLRLTAYLGAVGGDEIVAQYSFLDPYLEGVRARFSGVSSLPALDKGWRGVVAGWDTALLNFADFPLLRLRRHGLSPDHLCALMLAGLVELDARFGTLYRILHPFPEEQRLTVGLLEDLVRFNQSGASVSGWQLARDLAALGLVTVHDEGKPRAARALSVSAPVWDAICLEEQQQPAPYLTYHDEVTLPALAALADLLPAALLERVARMPALVARGLAQGLILRGMRGSGQVRLLGALAREMGRDMLHVQRPPLADLPAACRLAGTLALLRPALPVVALELAPGEAVTLPPLAGYQGLFGLILNREGSVTGPQAEKCVTLHLPAPDRAARQAQWQRVLDGHANGTQALIAQVSGRYHLTLGAVSQVGQLAQAYAALDEREHVAAEDVQQASRALNRQTLENLARHIPVAADWEGLIVSEVTRAELETLVLRCRHRETVLDHLSRGFAGTTRGVRALFGGPSGTGKTLAARIVAGALGLDLYRVDLASVVSKYIGETERNLSQLFARAEEQDIILLLDEGDALLTARTDVRNANDRYANLETNYLLQRLEQYEGIILITTNASKRIDGAFQRRIDVFVEFTMPDAGQRQRLWRLHIPEAHSVSDSFLQQASLRCALSGGQIRNAALHATVLAVEAAAPVDDAFLAAGIDREYTKMGAASPLS
jgi:hypothetical protein